jgi:MYXO-CTERM domain-containing protein
LLLSASTSLLLLTSVPSPAFADDTVTVDLGTVAGAPTYRASGFIYGISQDGSQPPNATLTDIKVTHLRCGGAQIGCPNGGYVNGQYAARWNAVKAYYSKAKAIGATLLVLVHDIWGADGACNVSKYPGDGGDWTGYTTFINQLITDFKAAGMTGKDVRWELWNEPDYSGFWKGTQAQWLEMWKRGYQQVRAALPDAVIEGPSTAGGVGGWFTAFLDYVKTNNVVPDYIGWHEAGGGDPVNDGKSANSALSSRSLSVSNLDVSEYGSTGDQTAGHSAWYLARFERAGVDGLRSNWGGGNGLYSTMGGMVTSSWQPKGQWWIYKRYADQTGLQATVTAGSQADAVAYLDSAARKSIIVVGNKGSVTGTVSVKINNIPADLQAAGPVRVLVENMPDGTAAVSAPTVVSNGPETVTGNSLIVPLSWTKAADGYAITLTFGDQDAGMSGKDSGSDTAVDARGQGSSTGGSSGSGDSTATGGASDSGGSSGTGGASGATSSGGTSGTGGAAGAAGAPKGTGGTAGTTATSTESSGCSCSTGGHSDRSAKAIWLLWGLVAIRRRPSPLKRERSLS